MSEHVVLLNAASATQMVYFSVGVAEPENIMFISFVFYMLESLSLGDDCLFNNQQFSKQERNQNEISSMSRRLIASLRLLWLRVGPQLAHRR